MEAKCSHQRAVEQSLTLGVKITEAIGLKAVGQNTKQEMTGEVRRRSPPQDREPTSPKRTDVEIAQARNLDVDCLPLRDRRADPDARHCDQDGRRLDWRAADLPLPALAIW